MQGNPRLLQQGQVDMAICEGEVQKAAVGQAPIYWRGLVGALAADAVVAQRQQGLVAIAKGCMAERGYLLVPRSELPK